MPLPKPISEPKQLAVEGSDAERFFRAFLQEIRLSGIQVQDFGGTNDLQGFLKALRNAPNFAASVTSLGIIRDAENNPQGAFQSVCSALTNAGLAAPGQPGISGGVNPQIAVYILPNATTAGMLETVCLDSVADDPAIPCVKEFFECVKRQTGTLPTNMYKAQIHAFLASRIRPNLRLGEAADAGYWPWDSPVFDQVKQFLQAL